MVVIAPVSGSNALRSIATSALRFVSLVLTARIFQPRCNVGSYLTFTNGNTARVFRETVVDCDRHELPAVLVVEFRLRGVHGLAHKLFEAESLLNTPLFAGFPGLISKLWLAADENEVYRGIYEWDGAQLAESYAQAICMLLSLVCEPGSVNYRITRNMKRGEYLAALERAAEDASMIWDAWSA